MTTVTKADREAAATAFTCLPFYVYKWNGRDHDIVGVDERRTAAVQAWVETGDDTAGSKLDDLLVHPDGTPMDLSIHTLEISAAVIAEVRELATARVKEQCISLLNKADDISMPTKVKVARATDELFPTDEAVCPVHDMLTHGKEAETLRAGIEYILSAYRLQHGKEGVEKLYQKGLEELLDGTAATDSEAYCERQAKKELNTQDAENLAAFRAHPHADYAALSLKKSMGDGFVAPELREALTLAEKVLFPDGVP